MQTDDGFKADIMNTLLRTAPWVALDLSGMEKNSRVNTEINAFRCLGNRINDEGAKKVSELLTWNSSLTRLDLTCMINGRSITEGFM